MDKKTRKRVAPVAVAILWALVLAAFGGISQAQAIADIGQVALSVMAARLAPWAERWQALGLELTLANFLLLVAVGAVAGFAVGLVKALRHRRA